MNPWLNFLTRSSTIAVMIVSVTMLTKLFENAPLKTAKPAQTNPVLAMVENWSGAVNYAPAYAALNPYADVSEKTAGSAFDPNDDYWGLPRSEGHETIAAYCGSCHSLQIVMQQRQSRDGWDYLLHWMVDKQGMAEPAPDMRTEMLDYLSREFGE